MGFATLWAGEHVIMVDRPESRYPYAADGQIAVPAAADWLDPLVGLSFAAAATSRIRIATGVLLLPEHNPVLLAKQAASLDVLCGGRLTLGVGIGWSRKEFASLGIRSPAGGSARPSTCGRCGRSGTTMWPDLTVSSSRSQRCGSIPSPSEIAGSRLSSAATATLRCGVWPTGATACTASTWPVLTRCANACRCFGGSAKRRDETSAGLTSPWRWLLPRLATSRR